MSLHLYRKRSIVVHMQNEMSPVARKVRGILAEKRLSQDDTAQLLGISRTAISRKLNGKGDFTARELKLLSDGLNVKVGAFFGEVAA